MCFHISQTKIGRELKERYQARIVFPKENESALPFFYHANGFAHPEIPVIPQEEPSVITTAHWGLAPTDVLEDKLTAYYKKAVAFGGGLNAQSEKLFTHFLYKQAAFSRRCLIPVTGFFEPHEFQKKKFPYFINRRDGESIALAGLYTRLGTTLSCTILTKPASERFAAIHNSKKRQPVLLDQKHEKDWLNDGLDANQLQSLIDSAYPEEQLSSFTVSRTVFNPRENSNTPEALLPVEYPELMNLF